MKREREGGMEGGREGGRDGGGEKMRRSKGRKSNVNCS